MVISERYIVNFPKASGMNEDTFRAEVKGYVENYTQKDEALVIVKILEDNDKELKVLIEVRAVIYNVDIILHDLLSDYVCTYEQVTGTDSER